MIDGTFITPSSTIFCNQYGPSEFTYDDVVLTGSIISRTYEALVHGGYIYEDRNKIISDCATWAFKEIISAFKARNRLGCVTGDTLFSTDALPIGKIISARISICDPDDVRVQTEIEVAPGPCFDKWLLAHLQAMIKPPDEPLVKVNAVPYSAILSGEEYEAIVDRIKRGLKPENLYTPDSILGRVTEIKEEDGGVYCRCTLERRNKPLNIRIGGNIGGTLKTIGYRMVPVSVKWIPGFKNFLADHYKQAFDAFLRTHDKKETYENFVEFMNRGNKATNSLMMYEGEPFGRITEFTQNTFVDCCGIDISIDVESGEQYRTLKKMFKDYIENFSKDKEEDKSMPFHYEHCSSIPRPKRIIYNDPATIVFWTDGTKTVVKKSESCKPKEKFNKYHAFCAALAKKLYGNNSRVNAYVESGFDQTAKKKAKKAPAKKETVKKETNNG